MAQTIDSPMARVDGQPVQLDTAPALIDGRTLVPLRFIGETFGYQVDTAETPRVFTIYMTKQ